MSKNQSKRSQETEPPPRRLTHDNVYSSKSLSKSSNVIIRSILRSSALRNNLLQLFRIKLPRQKTQFLDSLLFECFIGNWHDHFANVAISTDDSYSRGLRSHFVYEVCNDGKITQVVDEADCKISLCGASVRGPGSARRRATRDLQMKANRQMKNETKSSNFFPSHDYA